MTQSKYKILIVEDNAVDRELLTGILNKMNNHFEVSSAASCWEAQEELKKNIPDLVLLDIYLPDKDGFYLLKELHKNGYSEIPVILVSAFPKESDKLIGFALGATDFINKPIVTEDMKARIAVQYRLKKIKDDQQWAFRKTNEAIKILYKELENKNKRLRELDQLKDEFVNNVSHELRTPLTIIQGGIGLVTDGLLGEINEKQRKHLNISLENIDRLGKIINDLLDVATIENKKLKLDKGVVNINALIEEVVSDFTPQIAKKGLAINCVPAKERADVFVDKDKMVQVLVNLVGNACKFTDKGTIEVSVINNENTVECAVKDTGVGIAPQDLPRLFSKFEQIGRQAGEGPKGTGLGLSIAKGIIEAHEGQIKVESRQGEGTEFIFTLPKCVYPEGNFPNLILCLREGLKKYNCFSVIGFKINGSSGESNAALNNFTSVIKKSLYRQSDHVILEKEGVFIILPDIEKGNADIVAQRIRKAIEETDQFEKLKGHQGFDFHIVSFPQDGRAEDDLVVKLRL